MNNKKQSAETKTEQSTEAQVKTASHSNGNTYVGCSTYLLTFFAFLFCYINAISQSFISENIKDSIKRIDSTFYYNYNYSYVNKLSEKEKNKLEKLFIKSRRKKYFKLAFNSAN